VPACPSMRRSPSTTPQVLGPAAFCRGGVHTAHPARRPRQWPQGQAGSGQAGMTPACVGAGCRPRRWRRALTGPRPATDAAHMQTAGPTKAIPAGTRVSVSTHLSGHDKHAPGGHSRRHKCIWGRGARWRGASAGRLEVRSLRSLCRRSAGRLLRLQGLLQGQARIRYQPVHNIYVRLVCFWNFAADDPSARHFSQGLRSTCNSKGAQSMTCRMLPPAARRTSLPSGKQAGSVCDKKDTAACIVLECRPR
jgi:hypothetical protein